MKRVISLLLCALLALSLAGCGGKTEKEVDVPGLATALAAQVSFEAELKTLTAEQLGNFVTLPQGAEAAAYMSGGTTAVFVRWLLSDCADPVPELAKSLAYYLNGVFNGHKKR